MTTKNVNETLYSLTNNLLRLQEFIEQAENAEELADLIADSKEALEVSFDEKLEGMMTIRQNKLARINALEEEAARLKKLAESESKAIGRIEKYAASELEKLGHNYKEKAKKTVGKFDLQFKKLPPKLEIVDQSKIPAQYMNIPTPPPAAPDKKELLDLLKKKAEFLHGKKWTKEIDGLDLEEFGIKLVNNNSKFEVK
jgi:hypothetical protein